MDAQALEDASGRGEEGSVTKAIFMDRDGTLIREVGYLKMIEDMKFTPHASEALRIFHDLGFLNIVITNQSAVARGLLRKVSKLLQQIRDLFTLIEYTKPYTLKQQLNF